MLKINLWSLEQRVESLREMDLTLAKMGVVSRDTVWRDYGGGLKATADETKKNWERIASDDKLYQNAIFAYMVATLEPFTLSTIKGIV